MFSKQTLVKETMASLVVFFVALPLCLGIAIASGVPPLFGIISGVIGGLIVAPIAGVPLQVSGPAAGLTVMTFQFVGNYGIGSLVWLGLIVGTLQALAGIARVGDFFRANSPGLVKGMLGGIGLLILFSQLLVGLEVEPSGSGLNNMEKVPQAVIDSFISRPQSLVLVIAMSILIYAWSYVPKRFSISKLPSSLVGVAAGTLIAALLFHDVKFVEVPTNILQDLNFISYKKLESFSFSLFFAALGIAFVASAETLLSAVATDRMAKKVGSDYNRELLAQGAGNFMAGIFGAIPITGVIVRSSANIEAGSKTRLSAVFHGLWLLLFVFGLPFLLNYIPVASLAAILVVTGIKLLDLPSGPALWRQDKGEFAVYFVTIMGVFAVDILVGVILGFLASMIHLVFRMSKLQIKVEESEKTMTLKFFGVASFICIPQISKALNKIKTDSCCIDLSKLIFIDAAVSEQLSVWYEMARASGKDVRMILKSEPNQLENLAAELDTEAQVHPHADS